MSDELKDEQFRAFYGLLRSKRFDDLILQLKIYAIFLEEKIFPYEDPDSTHPTHKKREEIYFPGEKTPYSFDPNSLSMRLLRHIRDEAHRFGITFHRKRRNKETFKTILQGIPEIGIERKKKILKYYTLYYLVLKESFFF